MAAAAIPNQKHITVCKEKCSKTDLYAMYNLEAMQYAMSNLDGESFKLWCYLGKNQNGYSFDLSKVAALNYGVGSKSSYDRGVKELIAKGFLVEIEKDDFRFIEYPKPTE